MKRNNLTIYALLALTTAVCLGGCQKEEKIGGTAVQSMAGEWWVKFDNGNDPAGDFLNRYYSLATYNTASNKADSMWVDDYATNANTPSHPFWAIKGKVGTNISSLTFSGTNVVNEDYTSTFTIKNGKVIKNGAIAPGSKMRTDSIYFEIQFSDDAPGVTHKAAGYARTRYDADDHYQ